MYADLPVYLKELVKEHLLANDFPTAKRIHDEWIAKYKNTTNSYPDKENTDQPACAEHA